MFSGTEKANCSEEDSHETWAWMDYDRRLDDIMERDFYRSLLEWVSSGFMISYLRANSRVTRQKPCFMLRMNGVEN